MHSRVLTTSPLYVCGPTASGKSTTAIVLAQALNGEIVNADAFQLYRGLEIITAAPSAEERALVPHHLYGVADPGESHDAASYLAMATPVIDDIVKRGRLPIVVGGSGLYLKFLTHGPSPLPPGDPELRKELAALSLPQLFAKLQELDPEGAAEIDRHNPRYVQRAVEICLLTGEPASKLRASFAKVDERHLRGVILEWERSELHQRIEQRTDQMLQNGAIEEVNNVGEISETTAKAIGIPEITAYLAGSTSLEDCQTQICTSSRQYAKRQMTWFRREKWLRPLSGAASQDEIVSQAQQR